MIYLRLYYEFFKTGLFTFGGGLAAIPFLQEISEKTGWYTIEQLMDILAVSEATPGPIGANMATYSGYVTAGILGGVIATVGLITPSVIITLIVARVLAKFKDSDLVVSAFYGLRPASLGLVAAAGISVARLSLLKNDTWEEVGAIIDILDYKAALLAIILFFLIKKTNAHPLAFLAGSAVVGVIFKF